MKVGDYVQVTTKQAFWARARVTKLERGIATLFYRTVFIDHGEVKQSNCYDQVVLAGAEVRVFDETR